jgi:mannose-6-phosphate isomerase-like protein (cupin superfamily)
MLTFPAGFADLPLGILEDSAVENAPEVHRHEGDLWQCVEGAVTFVVNGELVGATGRVREDGSPNPDELVGERIEGGTTYTLGPGDWLWIPPGVPHQHTAVGTARLVIIKIRGRGV